MKTKAVLIIAGLAFVIGLLLAFFLMLIFKPKPKIVEISVPDTTIVHVYQVDTLWNDSIIFRDSIVYIDSATSIGEIPIREIKNSDSISIIIGDKRHHIGYELTCWYRGIFYEYQLNIEERKFSYSQKEPGQMKFYGELLGMLGRHWELSGATEAGIRILNRCALFGRIEADENLELVPKVGFKIIF